MIKYLGSKRRLIPTLGALVRASGARTAVDLFTGTTRVAQEMKGQGIAVTAVDTARYSEVFARCYVESDADAIDRGGLGSALARLAALPGRPGYFTQTFCVESRFFRPENGARIDAIRDAIDHDHAGTPLHPILLTSLIEAADRVDSTTGVQMAYLKEWAPRSHRPLELRVPALLPGGGRAVRGDAVALAGALGDFDLAYLDPPYNQHRYYGNYHVWETLVAWDAPEHYGVACKRIDARAPAATSAFNRRRRAADALREVVSTVTASTVVLSYSDDAWLSIDELRACCDARETVEVVSFDSRRYVGAQIGVHSPQGERVGSVGPSHNREHMVISGERATVRRMVEAIAADASVSAQ